MMLSPCDSGLGEPQAVRLYTTETISCIECLFGHLCQSGPLGSPNEDKPDIIRLILEGAVLHTITGNPDAFDYRDDIVGWSTAILAAIIRDLSLRLCEPAAIQDGVQLFEALALTEVKGEDGHTLTWDLGEWLRTQAQEILRHCPSSTAGMQDIHDALTAIYPLCEHNYELRTYWDRIGYPGLPGDIVSVFLLQGA